MSERDFIIILILALPLVFCGGVWLGCRIQQEQERIRREEDAAKLRHMGSERMVLHGPHDPRGAAFWDAGCWLDEHR